jgi:2,4-dienoyl-CoA reductase-like NADH-dependent reductase (Old Yellow Enzyme family)
MIFKSIERKGNVIKSPFYFAPINTGLVEDGNPTNELIEFHRSKSNNYTGINYVGNVAISKDYITNRRTLYVNQQMGSYENLAKQISDRGSLPGAQIACYRSKYTLNTQFKARNVSEYVSFVRNEVCAMSAQDLQKIISQFADGIRKLYNAGFKVVQIHAAHGYFLNNFLSKTYNSRQDEYGLDNFLIIREIIHSISDIVKNLVLDLRVSLYETEIETILNEDHKSFLDELYKIDGLDIISISNGIYNIDKTLIYPTKTHGNNFLVKILEGYIATKPEKIWNLSGNIRDLNKLPLSLQNISYSIGRSILADNNFLPQYFENSSMINECKYSNKCHYYSRGKDFITCPVNQKLF